MSVDTIKKQIDQENTNQENIVETLDLYRVEITEQIKPFVKEKVKNIVESEVKQKAEHTKELGTDKLKAMKQQLTTLVEQSDELVDAVFRYDELWLHINYSIYPNGGDKKEIMLKRQKKILLEELKRLWGKLVKS